MTPDTIPAAGGLLGFIAFCAVVGVALWFVSTEARLWMRHQYRRARAWWRR